MKGIILAGGSGTRLYPITHAISKHLIPIYDKPMIYYPLSILMLTGVKDIAIITTPYDYDAFQRLLLNGEQWGININYIVQPFPKGLAEAFVLSEEFLSGDAACLVLGDNIFYGHGLPILLEKVKYQIDQQGGACVFSYWVSDPKRYGIVEFDQYRKVLSIEEKPIRPKSNHAVTGLYFYDGTACQLAKTIKPSERGELEISSLNQLYLSKQRLRVEPLGRGYAWLDTGTNESMMEASSFIATIEKRQGLKIGCIEEIAYLNKWINIVQLENLAQKLEKSVYGNYLLKLIERDKK